MHKPQKLLLSFSTTRILSIILIFVVLLTQGLSAQTEEQKKHPKFPELTEHYKAGNVAYKKGDYDTALTEGHNALELAIEIFGKYDTTTATFYNNLGSVYDSKGDDDKAIEYYKQSLDILVIATGTDHPNIADFFGKIGSIYYRKKDYDKAIEYLKAAIDIYVTISAKDHISDLISISNAIGKTYQIKGDNIKAKEWFDKVQYMKNRNPLG